MLGSAGTNSANLTDTQEVTRSAGSFVSRKIWLPKGLYDALPYFYLIAGLAAFLATLYISTWLWVLPHYLLFSAACVHLGVLILRRRRRRDLPGLRRARRGRALEESLHPGSGVLRERAYVAPELRQSLFDSLAHTVIECPAFATCLRQNLQHLRDRTYWRQLFGCHQIGFFHRQHRAQNRVTVSRDHPSIEEILFHQRFNTLLGADF